MKTSSRGFGRVFSAMALAAGLASLGWVQNPPPPGAPQGPPPGGTGRGARGPAATPRQTAPVDFTGTWVSVVTEEWRIRMLTPRKGTDFDGLPMTAAARAAAMAWDPAADEAAGLQCKGYGAPALMRLPGRARISWEDDTTLKLEYDTGEQTRLLHFGGRPPAGSQPSWQGYSVAEWELQGPVVARGGFGALARGGAPAGGAPPAGASGPPGGGPPAGAPPPAGGTAGRRRSTSARWCGRWAGSRLRVWTAAAVAIVEGRDDPAAPRLRAEERRSVQRERGAHGVLRPSHRGERRYVVHGHEHHRGSREHQHGVHHELGLQERGERLQVGADAVRSEVRGMTMKPFVALVSGAMLVMTPATARAQVDLSGFWSNPNFEDVQERIDGPALGDYLGLPLSAAGRRAAETWDASILSIREHQCQDYPADYQSNSTWSFDMWKDTDPATHALIAWRTRLQVHGS